jgi:hypothetical protein
MPAHALLAPVVALVVWSLVVWAWLYATRLPAMRKLGVQPQEGAFARELNSKMPAHARQVADNYNHLMEQPTIFYALCLTLHVMGPQPAVAAQLAWTYVGLRVVHTLVQTTFNRVEVRFAVFFLSSLALIGLAVLAAGQAFASGPL